MCVIYRRNAVAPTLPDEPPEVVDDLARRPGRQRSVVAALTERDDADRDRDNVPA